MVGWVGLVLAASPGGDRSIQALAATAEFAFVGKVVSSDLVTMSDGRSVSPGRVWTVQLTQSLKGRFDTPQIDVHMPMSFMVPIQSDFVSGMALPPAPPVERSVLILARLQRGSSDFGHMQQTQQPYGDLLVLESLGSVWVQERDEAVRHHASHLAPQPVSWTQAIADVRAAPLDTPPGRTLPSVTPAARHPAQSLPSHTGPFQPSPLVLPVETPSAPPRAIRSSRFVRHRDQHAEQLLRYAVPGPEVRWIEGDHSDDARRARDDQGARRRDHPETHSLRALSAALFEYSAQAAEAGMPYTADVVATRADALYMLTADEQVPLQLARAHGCMLTDLGESCALPQCLGARRAALLAEMVCDDPQLPLPEALTAPFTTWQ
jgi:hypothetical protein